MNQGFRVQIPCSALKDTHRISDNKKLKIYIVFCVLSLGDLLGLPVLRVLRLTVSKYVCELLFSRPNEHATAIDN